MEARYLKVRGVPDKLVPHPYAASRRYLGKSPNGVSWEGAQPVGEVIADTKDGTLRKAIARGALVLVAECVASSLDEAAVKLAEEN